MKILNIKDILSKGLKDESNLSEIEWPVYVVAYFESVADMEGWDHFFLYSMKWYKLLINTLSSTGDHSSIRIISDYEKHFKTLGVQFTSANIDIYLSTASTDYLDSCPDWREQFSGACKQRWELIVQHYLEFGIDLKT